MKSEEKIDNFLYSLDILNEEELCISLTMMDIVHLSLLNNISSEILHHKIKINSSLN